MRSACMGPARETERVCDERPCNRADRLSPAEKFEMNSSFRR